MSKHTEIAAIEPLLSRFNYVTYSWSKYVLLSLEFWKMDTTVNINQEARKSL